MEYQLALELKKGGFPQKQWGRVVVDPKCGCTEYLGENLVHPGDGDCLVFDPTLDELIEACGREFRGLEAGDWLAEDKSVIWYAKSKDGNIVEGPTPREAVAKLWLALRPT